MTEDDLNRIANEEADRWQSQTNRQIQPAPAQRVPTRRVDSDTVDWMQPGGSPPPPQGPPPQYTQNNYGHGHGAQQVVNVIVQAHPHGTTSEGLNPGVAAILSFFIPGLGQMCQGRIAVGLVFFLATLVGYVFTLMLCGIGGFAIHVISVIEAALFKPSRR